MKYEDDKVRCNLCETTFTRFSSFGTRDRENVLCPNCNALESTRVLWFYLKDEVLSKSNNLNLLYFAPEPIIAEKLQGFNLNVTKCPLSYITDLHSLSSEEKLDGKIYAIILLAHVLQYTKDEQLVFEELKRLLRPSGFVLIQTLINWKMERTYESPTNEEDIDRLKSIFEPGVERIYGADFKKQLVKAGFHVEMIDYADQLGSFARNYYLLGDGSREIIFKCKK